MGCHVLLLIFGGARASYLYIDAYNTKGEFPVWLDHALTAVGMPTLASALHLVFVALIVTSKVSEDNCGTIMWDNYGTNM